MEPHEAGGVSIGCGFPSMYILSCGMYNSPPVNELYHPAWDVHRGRHSGPIMYSDPLLKEAVAVNSPSPLPALSPAEPWIRCIFEFRRSVASNALHVQLLGFSQWIQLSWLHISCVPLSIGTFQKLCRVWHHLELFQAKNLLVTNKRHLMLVARFCRSLHQTEVLSMVRIGEES